MSETEAPSHHLMRLRWFNNHWPGHGSSDMFNALVNRLAPWTSVRSIDIASPAPCSISSYFIFNLILFCVEHKIEDFSVLDFGIVAQIMSNDQAERISTSYHLMNIFSRDNVDIK